MLELARPLLVRLAQGRRVVAVTVTHVPGSAPRGAGSSMAVTDDGEVLGSISGGCVETDAVALAYSVLANRAPQSSRFGFTEEAAHAAGLACGGEIYVIAYEICFSDPIAVDALSSAAADKPTSVALELEGEYAGKFLAQGGHRWRPSMDAAVEAVSGSIDARITADESKVLVLAYRAKPRLIILGTSEHASALCRVGAAAGFAVTVCDLWELMLTTQRFPDAVELALSDPSTYLTQEAVEGRLDAGSAVCVLTHDVRSDVPALVAALRSDAAFVGAIGARRTVEYRQRALREGGLPDSMVARLHSPIGLDLGGASAEEVAISILAEVIQNRHGGTARPLRETTGRLHR